MWGIKKIMSVKMDGTRNIEYVINWKKNKLIQTSECYYEIDLGDIKHIKSILTFGKYPNNRHFPRRKIRNNYNIYYCDTNKPYVNVVDIINDDSYVTNYSISYKK